MITVGGQVDAQWFVSSPLRGETSSLLRGETMVEAEREGAMRWQMALSSTVHASAL